MFTRKKQAVSHAYPRSPRGKGNLIERAIRTERYRRVEWKRPGAPAETVDLELYDHQTDPAAMENLAEKKPRIVTKLRAILAKQPEAKPQFRSSR